MKANISRGAGFEGLCRYVLDLKNDSKGAKKAEVIGGNIAGNSYADIMSNFKVVQKIRPDIKRPVWHCSLSFPPGENPDNETLARIAAEFMRRMGISEVNPYSVIRHQDTAHAHIHIVASRIGLDGKVWQGAFEALKAMRITQELEEEFGLVQTEGYQSGAEKKNTKFGERRMEDRTGQASPKVQLQELIDEIVATSPTAVEFCEYLEASGVEVRANLASTGTLNGFSFAIDGVAFKGSKLGKAYTWAWLQVRGVNYDKGRDFAALSRFAAGTGRRPAPSKEAVAEARSQLSGLIKKIVAKRPTVVEFCEFMWANEVTVKLKITKTRELNGLFFVIDGLTLNSSSPGKPAQIWEDLQRRGVSYDPNRDFEGLVKFILNTRQSPPAPPAAGTDPGPAPNEFSLQPKNRLKKLIKEAVIERPTVVEFCERLVAQGVIVRANLARTGKLNGFTFTIDGVTFKGSSLGKAYSWRGLQEMGVTYEPKRDQEGLERYKAGATSQPTVDGTGEDAGKPKEGDRGPTQGGGPGGGSGSGGGGKGKSGIGEDDLGSGGSNESSEADSDITKEVPGGDGGASSKNKGSKRKSDLEGDELLSAGGDSSRNGPDGIFTKVIRKAIEAKKEWERQQAIKKKQALEKARRERQRELDEEDEETVIFAQSSTKFVGHKGKIIRFPLWVGNIFVVKRLSEEEGYYLYPMNRQLDVASLIVWSNRIWVKRTDEETILNGLRLGLDIWPPEKKIKIQGDDQFKALVKHVVEKYGFGFDFISESEMRFMSRKEPEPEKPKPMLESTQDRPELVRPGPRLKP